jgi:hypothetical protein
MKLWDTVQVIEDRSSPLREWTYYIVQWTEQVWHQLMVDIWEDANYDARRFRVVEWIRNNVVSILSKTN